MAMGRVNPANENEPFCMTVLALKVSARRQRRERIARPGQPPHVAVPLSRQKGRGSSHRPHHQRHSPAGLDEGPGAPFLAAQTDGTTSTAGAGNHNFGKTNRADWDKRSTRRILGKDGRPGLSSPTKNFGRCATALRRELIEFARRRLLLQGQRLTQGRFHRVRSTAESRRADHRFRAPLRHLQTRAADFPAVRKHREARARQATARAIHFRRQGAPARRRRQTFHPAHHSPEQIQRS